MNLLEAPAGASEVMREVYAAAATQPMTFSETAALKLVKDPLARLKTAPAEDRLAFVFEALSRLPFAPSFGLQLALRGMSAALLRADLPLTSLDAVRLVETVTQSRANFPYKAVLSALDGRPVTPALKEALLRLRPMITEYHGARDMRDIHERIDALVHGAPAAATPGAPIEPGSTWTRQVFQEIDLSPNQFAWRALFLHAKSLTQSSASRKWQSESVALIDRIGRAEFLDAGRRWLALGPMPGMPQTQMPEIEADFQKGFIWALGALGDASIAPEIADFAVACFRKIPQIGAVSHRAGNACVNALSAMPGLAAVAHLSRLSVRVKYDVARRLIEKALVEAAQRNNVSREDLEAMSVPTFGLEDNTENGQCRLSIVNGAAVLTPLKSATAELKKARKELESLLSTQRFRLERQLLAQTGCPIDRWQAWYIDHPVTGAFGRNLIWEFLTGGAVQTAIHHEGQMVDWSGNAVETRPETIVRLWHPIRADVQTILSWRCWLEDHGIRQPFKQAHREVYILTDAERQTGTYSNRFAAHIVRQHQFSALCRQRAWQFNLMGQWDSHNTPTLDLPQHKLRVEFNVDFPVNQEVTAHAVYLTIATGSMQFFAAEPKPERFSWPPRQPLALDQISPVVFSEVMRDADLLIGVTSIGSDPAWGAAHRDDPNHAYWQSFAFGDLAGAAENRRDVIEKLLPRLPIRNQCQLDGKFLTVRGELNEYKIHLGSGNILMEPGSRYLCIVQGPGDTAATLPLPFDGDAILSMILSKAFLLSNDKSIKDETIRRQITRS